MFILRTMLRSMVAALLLAPAAFSQESPKKLAPGQVLTFEFRTLPPTLYAVHTGFKVAPRLTARLPDNYTTTGRFPLFVFLEGGHGRAATEKELHRPRAITQDRDFIAVTMPLFKKHVDKDEPFEGLMIGVDDLPVFAHAYDVMLSRLLQAVPNVDTARSVLGGFSNGAHATALLVSSQDPTTLARFDNFYLIEGGFRLSGLHRRSLKDRHFLMMVGDQGDPRRRKAILDISAILDETAERYKVDFERVVMKDVGHAFPDTYYRVLRDWLARVTGLKPTTTTAPATRPS